jgi:hypothetical protein
MLRCREISSRELTEMLLERIDSVNPALNAVVELRRESALQEAATADEAIARGTTPEPSKNARSPHPKVSGPTTTRPSGCRMRHWQACLP